MVLGSNIGAMAWAINRRCLAVWYMNLLIDRAVGVFGRPLGLGVPFFARVCRALPIRPSPVLKSL